MHAGLTGMAMHARPPVGWTNMVGFQCLLALFFLTGAINALGAIGSKDGAIEAADIAVLVATTTGEKFEQRVAQARRTWALGRSVLFVGRHGQPGIEGVPCKDDAFAGFCCKKLFGLRLLLEHYPAASWLVLAADDTYVFVQQLARELRVFNANERIYVGAVSVLLACHIVDQPGACGEAHAGGGGGFVLSRPLAEELVLHEDNFLENCQRDDLHFGHFLRYAFDVHVHSLPGMWQEPRFKGFNVDPAADIPVCDLPLPPPVFARLDQAGPLRPFAPLEATRLSLLHSDPAIWPLLDLIPVTAATLHQVDALLAFVDVEGGQRVVAPGFHGQQLLSLCIHRRAARLLTFNAAAKLMNTRPQNVVAEMSTIRWAEERGHAAAIRQLCNDGCSVNEKFWAAGNFEHHVNTSVDQQHDELQIFISIVRKGARPADWNIDVMPRAW